MDKTTTAAAVLILVDCAELVFGVESLRIAPDTVTLATLELGVIVVVAFELAEPEVTVPEIVDIELDDVVERFTRLLLLLFVTEVEKLVLLDEMDG